MQVTPEMTAFAEQIRTRDAAIRRWLGKRNSYRPEDLPRALSPSPTNEERSRAEVIEFLTDPLGFGRGYLAYLSGDRKRVTTWTGETLADITHIMTRRVRRSWLSDECGSFTATGIDRRTYCGRHNGPGLYCRLYLLKAPEASMRHAIQLRVGSHTYPA